MEFETLRKANKLVAEIHKLTARCVKIYESLKEENCPKKAKILSDMYEEKTKILAELQRRFKKL